MELGQKHRELFLIVTPLFFIFSDIANFLGTYYVLVTNEEGEDWLDKELINIIFALNNFFVLMGHQIFGT